MPMPGQEKHREGVGERQKATRLSAMFPAITVGLLGLLQAYKKLCTAKI